MATWIKTGFWEKAQYGFKGWLNLDKLIEEIAGSGGTWGSITGDILDQTDLQNELDTKVDKTTTVNSQSLSGNVLLTKSNIGLSNVDNTSDVNKPVSTAQLTAINAKVADAINDGTTTIAPSQNAVFDALALKATIASPTFTGVPAGPTAAVGTNTTQLATTAFVQAKGRTILYKKNTPASAHTGTTAETLIDSYTITAGTMSANDILRVVIVFNKTGTAGNVTCRLRVATTSGVTGTVIGTPLLTSTNIWGTEGRELWFANSLTAQHAMNSAGSNPDVYGLSTSAGTDFTLDFTVNQVVNLTLVLASAADSMIIRDWYIERIRP